MAHIERSSDAWPRQRQRIVDAFARAMYACTFDQPIEESGDVETAWRIWRYEATRVLDAALMDADNVREALNEAIGWSYGEPFTPERRSELEGLT